MTRRDDACCLSFLVRYLNAHDCHENALIIILSETHNIIQNRDMMHWS